MCPQKNCHCVQLPEGAGLYPRVYIYSVYVLYCTPKYGIYRQDKIVKDGERLLTKEPPTPTHLIDVISTKKDTLWERY